MSSRDVAFVGIRLLAVYVALKLVYVLYSAGGLYWFLAGEGGAFPGPGGIKVTIWNGVFGAGMYLVVTSALWFSAGPLSRYVAPERASAGTVSELRVPEWMNIAFAAIGLYVLVYALSGIVRELHGALVLKGAYGEYRHVDPRDTALYWQLATEMVLGLVLLFGSSGLSGLLRRLQTFGLDQKQSPDD